MKIVNPDVLNFINDFNNDPSIEMERFRTCCENDHIPVIKRETESFLKTILNLLQPEKILEIGTGAGYSSTIFARECTNCQITTLELIDKRIAQAKERFIEHGINDQIKLIPGDASESLKILIDEMKDLQNSELFDFVFIDSAKSRYLEFFQGSLKICSTPGIIICDNVFLDGRTISDDYIQKRRDKTSANKMREFLKYLKDDEETSTSLLNIGDGISMSYFHRSKGIE